MSHFSRFSMLAAAGALLAACSGDSTGTGTPQAAVTLNLATRPGTLAALRTGSLADPLTLTDGTNTLVINSAQVVLRKIELKSSTGACDGNDDGQGGDDQGGGAEPGDDHGGSSGSGGADDPAGHAIRMAGLHDDDCGELKLGPLLVDLPLTSGTSQVFSAEVPQGTYDRVEYKIHRPSSSDTDFVAAHPDFNGVSIKVTGTWNGTPFTFTTGQEKEQETTLDPPLTVSASGPTDLTLLIDLDKWFRASDNSLVDPSSANAGGANEALVRTNIAGSDDCFEDENRDGRHDD